MNPCEINASVAAVTNILAAKLTKDELAYWGIILSKIGGSMTDLAALIDLCDGDSNSKSASGDDDLHPALIASGVD